jgi:hypothetical protein
MYEQDGALCRVVRAVSGGDIGSVAIDLENHP